MGELQPVRRADNSTVLVVLNIMETQLSFHHVSEP